MKIGKFIKRNRKFIGVFMIGLMFVGVMLGSTLTFKEDKGWHSIVFSASDTGDSAPSIQNIYIYPIGEKADITSSPYECNEVDAYEHGDDVDGFDDGEELTGSTPYGANNHIIAVEVKFDNKAYNTSTADWETGLVRAYITSSDLGLSSELMEKAPDFSQQTGSTSAHLTFYVDNSDNGFTCGQGETISIDDLDIQYFGTT